MIVQRLFLLPGQPTIVGKEFAEVECGCKVCQGVRTDTQEVATAAIPCGPEHLKMMEEFQMRMRSSLVEPTEDALIDVTDRMLTTLYNERTREDARRADARRSS